MRHRSIAIASRPPMGWRHRIDGRRWGAMAMLAALFTVSATGRKEEVWCIGKSKNPRCFKGINRELLRVKYRYNKTKWMTGLIMEEYLRWLDNKMRGQGRKVLLLLDNFTGHELGVKLVGGKEGRDNVRIEWLPPNTTSRWQPLDQ